MLCRFYFAYTAWPVLPVYVVNLALCARVSNNFIKIKLKRNINPRLVVTLILLSCNLLSGIDAGKNLLFQNQFRNVDSLSSNKQYEFYNKLKDRYGLYAPFVFKYATVLNFEGKNKEAFEVLHQLNEYSPSYQTNYQLAETCREMNDMKSAKVYYEEAIKFLPNRILPRYHLFMAELLQKNYAKADSIRKQILKHEFKGDTIFINQIKKSLCAYNLYE